MTNVQKFKRFLKELGIYSVWLKERKKFIKKHRPGEEIFRYAIAYGYNVGEIINLSFWWDETSNENLWCKLSRMTYMVSISSCLDEQRIKGLKFIIYQHYE